MADPPKGDGAAGTSAAEEDFWMSDGEVDSDEGEGEMKGEPPEFYGSDVDDEDEKWVEKQRGGRKSDAILSCPCCLETVCIDCQRHDVHEDQFRAMFVTNCKVKLGVVLRSAAPPGKGRKGSGGRGRGAGGGASGGAGGGGGGEPPQRGKDEVFHPVECAQCETEVGVKDMEDVYHFFNIVASGA